MKSTIAFLVASGLVTPTTLVQRVDAGQNRAAIEAELEVHDTVVEFLDLLGALRLELVGQLMTDNANVITARWSRSGFVNRVQSREEWLEGLAGAPPRPFREVLTNVDVHIESGVLAVMKADFAIVRDTGVAFRGVDFFTLVRQNDRWKVASIAFTSIPETGGPE